MVNYALDLGFVPEREHILSEFYQPIVIKYITWCFLTVNH